MTSLGPIVLIGTHRSGTTWLGQALSRSSDVAYWPEPRQVWSWGHWFRDDDVLTAADATPLVVRHIHSTFSAFVTASGCHRLCEKTPGNCFRIPFIRAVYPNVRIILIIRDGRSVIRSTRSIQETGPRWARIWQRVRETPIWEWPAHWARLPWLLDKLLGRPTKFWGVRPPGWRQWVKDDPPLVVLAKQWASSIRRAVADGRALPQENYFEVKYETLVTAPRETMQAVLDFAQIKDSRPIVEEVCRTAQSDGIDSWRAELSASELETIRPYMAPMLGELGYE